MPAASPEQAEPLRLLNRTTIGLSKLRQSGAGLVEGEPTAQRVVAAEHRLTSVARFQ